MKAVRPGLQVGFHIEHVNSFNPDLPRDAELRRPGGEGRFPEGRGRTTTAAANATRTSSDNVGSTVFRDVPKEELLRFNNHLLNYGDEAS